jgi:hypothetical protein
LRRSILITFFTLLVVATSGLMAKTEPAGRSDFEAGVDAFSEGELTKALALFEQARAAGMNTPPLLYNMGVVYFRLGRHELAESVFQELLDTPHAALARYNLGLVKLASGQQRAAQKWFELAAGPDSPEKVRVLARRQLDESEQSVQVEGLNGSGYLAAAGGYDDNIAGTPDDASSNQAGGFADLLAAGSVNLGASDFSLHGVAYTREYFQNSEFDNSYLSTGISWLQGVGAGELTSTLSLANSWFGGDALERQVQLETAYQPGYCVVGVGGTGFDCALSGSVTTTKGGSGFSAYDGEMLRIGASAEKGIGRWVVSGRYQLEVNDRQDLETQQEFFSVSPLRNLVSAEARYRISDRFSVGGRGDIRHSRYMDKHRLLSGSGVASERRTDNRLRGILLAEYRVTSQWLMLAEWSMMNNRSSIERYDYSRREVMVGVEMGF